MHAPNLSGMEKATARCSRWFRTRYSALSGCSSPSLLLKNRNFDLVANAILGSSLRRGRHVLIGSFALMPVGARLIENALRRLGNFDVKERRPRRLRKSFS